MNSQKISQVLGKVAAFVMLFICGIFIFHFILKFGFDYTAPSDKRYLIGIAALIWAAIGSTGTSIKAKKAKTAKTEIKDKS